MTGALRETGPVLAIDTSGAACSVALAVSGELRAAASRPGRTGHSELLMDMVAQTLQEARLAFADLARIAVTVGPGSFTGVRIGLAAARGFAVTTGCPVVGVSTLEVTAAAAARDAGLAPGTVLRVISDARRGEVYWQDFEAGPAWWRLMPLTPPAVQPLAAMPALPAGAARTGSGLALTQPLDEITDIAGQDVPDAAALAHLGAASTLPTPYMPPRPLYLRAPDAKLPGGRAVPAP